MAINIKNNLDSKAYSDIVKSIMAIPKDKNIFAIKFNFDIIKPYLIFIDSKLFSNLIDSKIIKGLYALST